MVKDQALEYAKAWKMRYPAAEIKYASYTNEDFVVLGVLA
jgi:hypothetical protein